MKEIILYGLVRGVASSPLRKCSSPLKNVHGINEALKENGGKRRSASVKPY